MGGAERQQWLERAGSRSDKEAVSGNIVIYLVYVFIICEAESSLCPKNGIVNCPFYQPSVLNNALLVGYFLPLFLLTN